MGLCRLVDWLLAVALVIRLVLKAAFPPLVFVCLLTLRLLDQLRKVDKIYQAAAVITGMVARIATFIFSCTNRGLLRLPGADQNFEVTVSETAFRDAYRHPEWILA